MTERPNAYVGRPIPRIEDLRFLRGRGCFVDDIQRPGMAYATVVRSQVAHGRLNGVDGTAALALPGVQAVLTARDLARPPGLIPFRIAPLAGTEPFRQPVIASDKVRYVGEPLAIVIADSQALAEDAIAAVDVSIEAIEPVPDVAAAETGVSLLFETEGTNVASRYTAGRGDIEQAFAQADYTRRERFSVQRHTAMPMETRGLVAEWDEGRQHMTVWGAAKVPFFNRRVLASMLGLPERNVDLIELDVGGAFGVRGEFYPEDFLVPFASRLLGRPIKWIEDRREHMLATNHSREIACEIEIACSSAGQILGLRALVRADLGAYVGTTGGILASRTGQFLPGPYRIGSVALDVRSILTNRTPAGSYRGPGRFESSFFRERLLDLAARDLGLDAVAFRKRNLVTAQEMPYGIGQLVPYEAATSYDVGDYPAVLARCAEEIGWEEKRPIRGTQIDGRYHGLGIGCFVDSSGSGPKENARITLERDGSISVAVGSSAVGQGIETAHMQICADALRIGIDRIRVRHGSTTLLNEGFGSFHSRSIIMGGNAIAHAAENLIARFQDAASQRWNVSPDAVVYDGGVLRAEGRSALSLADLAASREDTLAAEGSFGTKEKPFGYGTHAAHVAVDIRTGHVEILDYVAVEDIGRMINPLLVRGQKLGSIAQGIGGVFLEELVYDQHGQLLTGSFADYLLPTASDVGPIRVFALDLTRTARNPLGVKGAGEDGISPVAGAIGNAIADALSSHGVVPRDLPITPPRLWQLIQSASSGTKTDSPAAVAPSASPQPGN